MGYIILIGIYLMVSYIFQYFDIKFPASIVGMLVLFSFLKLNILKPNWVKNEANFLTKYMALFFIPAGIGILSVWNVIKTDLWSIVGVAIITTIVTLITIGMIMRYFEIKKNDNDK